MTRPAQEAWGSDYRIVARMTTAYGKTPPLVSCSGTSAFLSLT